MYPNFTNKSSQSLQTKPYLISRQASRIHLKRRGERSPPPDDAAQLRGRSIRPNGGSAGLGSSSSTNAFATKVNNHHLPSVFVPHAESMQHNAARVFSAASLWSENTGPLRSTSATASSSSSTSTFTSNTHLVSTIAQQQQPPLLLVDTNCPFRASVARQFESEVQQSFPLPHSTISVGSSVVYTNKEASAGSIIVNLRYHESVPSCHYGGTDDPAAFCELLLSEKQLRSIQKNARLARDMQLFLSSVLERYFQIPPDRYYLRFLNRESKDDDPMNVKQLNQTSTTALVKQQHAQQQAQQDRMVMMNNTTAASGW